MWVVRVRGRQGGWRRGQGEAPPGHHPHSILMSWTSGAGSADTIHPPVGVPASLARTRTQPSHTGVAGFLKRSKSGEEGRSSSGDLWTGKGPRAPKGWPAQSYQGTQWAPGALHGTVTTRCVRVSECVCVCAAAPCQEAFILLRPSDPERLERSPNKPSPLTQLPNGPYRLYLLARLVASPRPPPLLRRPCDIFT